MATTLHTQAVFEPALACMLDLAEILVRGKRAALREEEAMALIDRRLLSQPGSEAEVYIAALLKAYVHTLLAESLPTEGLAQGLCEFIVGGYEVRGTPSSSHLYPREDVVALRAAQRWQFMQYQDQRLAATEPNTPQSEVPPIIGVHQGNHLAMWKICEQELAKQWGDSELARRLSASTARLLIPRNEVKGWGSEFKQPLKEAQTILVQTLSEYQSNPFAGARILEFAGHDNALTAENFPLLSLFRQYQDYTPSQDFVIDPDATEYITLAKPGEFFTQVRRWEEPQKFDYVIASNIFCQGAVRDKKYNHYGHRLVQDLLPHLANCLNENGKLIVSNTALDGINLVYHGINPRTGKQLHCMGGEYGLAGEEARAPLFNANPYFVKDSGIAVLRRDYTLRPPVAYTHEERKHDSNMSLRKDRRTNIVPPDEKQYGDCPKQKIVSSHYDEKRKRWVNTSITGAELDLQNSHAYKIRNGLPLTFMEKREEEETERLKRGPVSGWDIDL